MEEIVSASAPELVKVTDRAAEDEPAFVEAKARLAADRLAPGAATPAPLSATDCVALAALSAKISVAVNAPAAAGLKVTEAAQEAPAASDAPQLLVWAKDAALTPPRVMEDRFSAALPELVSVTDCEAEVKPVLVEEKVRLRGERTAAGAVVTVEGQPFTTLATLSEPRPVALS
jgi:hypothetical protein